MCLDRTVEGIKRSAQQWWHLRGEREVEGLQSGPHDPSVDLGEKEDDTATVGVRT